MSYIWTYCTNLKEPTDKNVSMGGQSFGTGLIKRMFTLHLLKRHWHCFSKSR